jgi:hypothetical protein
MTTEPGSALAQNQDEAAAAVRVRELRRSGRRVCVVNLLVVASVVATNWTLYSTIVQVLLATGVCLAVTGMVGVLRLPDRQLARPDARRVRNLGPRMLAMLLVTHGPVMALAALAAIFGW